MLSVLYCPAMRKTHRNYQAFCWYSNFYVMNIKDIIENRISFKNHYPTKGDLRWCASHEALIQIS